MEAKFNDNSCRSDILPQPRGQFAAVRARREALSSSALTDPLPLRFTPGLAKEFPMSFQSLDTAILSEIKRSNHQMRGDGMISLAQNSSLRISRLATAWLLNDSQN
ncbi:hypothetical protein K443DRAFT_677025 [Laccaria amethystina LaAM-08-1]|jgi:hypothetical protein|uniref:Uncharacterized protein n=1 Tax=Laccaria amethystina LaAM-08-1 TaxID=1095629 RepID=A0A0C9XZL9_9AGAR|nr:hypothetical protein K443DRAFT_677025 [Laccaria amethystina LaAM-08-1]